MQASLKTCSLCFLSGFVKHAALTRKGQLASLHKSQLRNNPQEMGYCNLSNIFNRQQESQFRSCILISYCTLHYNIFSFLARSPIHNKCSQSNLRSNSTVLFPFVTDLPLTFPFTSFSVDLVWLNSEPYLSARSPVGSPDTSPCGENHSHFLPLWSLLFPRGPAGSLACRCD